MSKYVFRRSHCTLTGARTLALVVSVGWLFACASDGTAPRGVMNNGGSPSVVPTAGYGAAAGGSMQTAAGGSSAGASPAAGGKPADGGGGSSVAGGLRMGGLGGVAATAGMTARGGSGAGGLGGGAKGGSGNTAGAAAHAGAAGDASSSGGMPAMGGAGASAGGAAGAAQSGGCSKTPSLKNSTSDSNPTPNTISVSGTNREYAIRWPANYENSHAYRLILDLHGYGGSYKETAGEDYFGLWTPSNDTTIFIALSAIDMDWRNGDNLAYVDAVLKAVEGDLCIDTTRIMLEGFSQGAAEVWQLACSRPGVFRAAVGHSGGGVTNPTSCTPIPYLGSGGLQESVTQTTQTDQFARWNGCSVTTLPTAPTGGHACSDYTGCPAADPVRWCNYDGPHTPLPTDSGMKSSWMPSETWPFFSQF